mmetsp:Transcript_55996/g.112217  ORF Transcript_55996/g.112217 Transcript_55996/m.112217 type:complete len:292 (+) Transcript_55996:58-933(+)|eukprot:CAMPEP_0171620780 /NCGR_PEP_ID=MMETSP0990-20121206/16201_1 /TAXON_ID=483369 /ORGANISM="non described non described, Strain CCMP2098" /LENGTH=291 /DNA_ID=CAMNT_0012186151 /DNA_START=58 /DNA_END=933 /DNA_ORIENTATION=-
MLALSLLVLLPSCTGLALRQPPSMSSAREGVDRRGFGTQVAGLGGLTFIPGLSHADPIATSGAKVLVAGATGQTGSRVYSQLTASYPGLTTVAGVRDPSKAAKSGIKGGVKLDLTDASTMSGALDGCDAVICAVGFVPGNPFEFSKAAHAVDNVGTCALIDACKAAGVKKFVLVTSILTDAGAWGQRGSVGFKITNAFGGVLDEKIVAEKHLAASGLDYTIVRPGGLKASPPSGKLVVAQGNTLNSGEVSRDLVAAVCIQALFAGASKDKIVELYENEEDGAVEAPKEKWF